MTTLPPVSVPEERLDEGPPGRWLGRPTPRLDDEPLLRGSAWFVDDLAPWPGLAEVAIVRAPLAHARLLGVETAAARQMPGVLGVLTGSDLERFLRPLPSVLSEAIPYRPIALDRVRYVGEPVAVVVATDRYRAEDAAEAVELDLDPLPAVPSAHAALDPTLPPLHEGLPNNVASDRTLRYGDPDAAFAQAELVVRARFQQPRSICTPLECFGVLCRTDPVSGDVEAWSNFQGPFSLQVVAAQALGIPPAKLHLRTPEHSGGSFGTKAAVYPLVVLLAACSRALGGRPLKYLEDRREHLMAATAAGERLSEVQAAFSAEGRLLALRLDLVDDVGAYVRAPEPATLYGMHPCLTGAYQVAHLEARCRVVLTNRCPTGLNRGYGGPQLYLALERTMAIAARRLGLDPAELARRNLVPPAAMPYTTASGGRYDSGDYPAVLALALERFDWAGKRARARAARAEGRLVGVGLACVVEPSVSNMGYVDLASPPEVRARRPAKSGNVEGVSLAMLPDGTVQLRTTTTPQGQAHATVLALVVAEALGVDPRQVQVRAGADTAVGPWSISSGNYSSRFAAVAAGAAWQAASALADQLRRLAAQDLGCHPEQVLLADGHARLVDDPERDVPLRRLAGRAHWDPASLPPGVRPGLSLTHHLAIPDLPAPDAQDRANGSATYGFLCDLCEVEVDRGTGRLEILDYLSVHDAGRILHPVLAEGQVHGGLAQGIGMACFEQLAFDPDGQPLSTTFLDYLCPTAPEVPEARTVFVESPSPLTPLGAKGLGEGTTMSAPAALANAVADALEVEEVPFPLTPEALWRVVHGAEG
ncbi:xanthine dehydrogenase family protein molybdopterin-binding subunit [Aciditerrimonas ferrireducens]|uniref:Xanthine dehydrogenase family protein molybdopterin-binding subunit n=1 Tax=Aciditerrimonas ferrireducens TaxID=667306 RepID=A0ABV6C2F8_9ACTN